MGPAYGVVVEIEEDRKPYTTSKCLYYGRSLSNNVSKCYPVLNRFFGPFPTINMYRSGPRRSMICPSMNSFMWLVLRGELGTRLPLAASDITSYEMKTGWSLWECGLKVASQLILHNRGFGLFARGPRTLLMSFSNSNNAANVSSGSSSVRLYNFGH